MSSLLSTLPPAERTRASIVAGLFAGLLLVVGVLPWVAAADVSVRLLATVALIAGVGLALISWGLHRSATLDQNDSALSVALDTAVHEAGIGGCDCGHEHDPDELVFADGPAAGEQQIKHSTGRAPDSCAAGHGQSGCDHSCATCALSALR